MSEKKNHKSIMLEAKYKRLHLSALERGDEVAAQKWLDELNKLKTTI
jgi:hypothetical protein